MERKRRHIFSMAVMTAAALLAGLNMAGAEIISGRISAITKEKKSTLIEIAPVPDAGGIQPSYRCTVSTDFQEIADMLMKAMETRTAVTVTSSDSCKLEGMLRHCGSIVTAETAAK